MTTKSPLPGLAILATAITLIAVIADKVGHADRVKQKNEAIER